jgi:hypothetical protein
MLFKQCYIVVLFISLASAREYQSEENERRSRRRDPSKLPPKFEASKYGFAEGDKVDVNKANTIQKEAESKGERSPNFFK